MVTIIALRPDFTGYDLRGLARRSKGAFLGPPAADVGSIYGGGMRFEAARRGNYTNPCFN